MNKIRYYWLLLRGKTKATRPAKLSLRNIFAVIQAWVRKKRDMAGFTLSPYIYEQIIWRRLKVMETSSDCWESGHCISCGCEILGKTMEDRACEESCYPEMMEKKQWKEHKRINNIKLFE